MEPVEALEKKPPEEQAELAAYRAPNGNLYVPAVALQRCFIQGAAYSKGKGRATLQKPVAACVLVFPEYLDTGLTTFALDARPVVIPATRGRVLRYRPRLDTWSFNASIEFDPDLLKEEELRRVVDDSGQRVGLLDFRPEKKGPFGRFVVVHWEASA
jgi:hypothetical protein